MTLIIDKDEQFDRLTWGAGGRPPETPVGDSSCDTADEVKAFTAKAGGSDTSRLIPSLMARQGGTLTLKLHGAGRLQQIRFEDENGGCTDGSPDCTHYHFLAWLPRHDAYVVYVNGYESIATIVVNASTGQQISLPGFPVWSPSGRWVAADSMTGPIDNISLGIWDWLAMAQREVFRVPWGRDTFCVQNWDGDSVLHLEDLRRGKPGTAADRTPNSVTLVNGKWHLSR